MILVLGGTGYIGSFITEYLDQCGFHYLSPTRIELDCYNQFELFDYVDSNCCTFVINAAGYTGKPNVEACEQNKWECYRANTFLPQVINQVCRLAGIKWGHISSGCVYNGHLKVYDETDKSDFSFEKGPCSWYSGTKAHGELAAGKDCYIWRIRMPFSSRSCPRNYLDKIMTYDELLIADNSITWVEEFVANLPFFWEHEIEPGIYNMVNSGSITSVEINQIFDEYGIKHSIKYLMLPDFNARFSVPRSNCVLSNDKSLSAGIAWTDVKTAIRKCLDNRVEPNASLDYRSLGLHWHQLSEAYSE